MIVSPNPSSELTKHIDYYWIVNDVPNTFGTLQNLLAFPGITPDMLIVLEGHVAIQYQGINQKTNKSQLFSFIHDKVTIDLSAIKSFILVKFKSRGLSSLLPFVNASSEFLIKSSIIEADSIFGPQINLLAKRLRQLDSDEMTAELDNWFLGHYKKERVGFMVDLAGELSKTYDLKEIMDATNYSYSTLERYFKKDTGLTPKKYQALRRYKQVVHEICVTQNSDWMHYVTQQGYYDQSHLIKEIKRYTSYTPAQLLQVPSFVSYRPMQV